MSELHFHITQERIENEMTLDMQVAVEDLQDGIYHPRAWRDLLSTFAADEQGQYLDEKIARQQVGRLKGEGLKEASQDFLRAFNEFALPKANGAPS